MKPDSSSTQVGAPPRSSAGLGAPDADAGITLTMVMPSRLEDAATIHDARLAAAPSAPDMPAGQPTRVRYAILGQAGQGGMATVHVARDLELMRKVALKQLADELRDAESARVRFLREVQITAQLDHPYIVPVYGLEVAPGGAPAYAMKLVQGRTLSDYLREAREAYADGGRPDEEHDLPARLEHFLKVCDAVDYAHGKGVIHRDLKPANVMLGAHREVYVMDWGICRLFGQDDPAFDAGAPLADSSGGNQTEIGSVVGTPRYMSPEQAQGRSGELGPRSDQCALGLMLFELVTLRSPLDGDTALQVLENAAHARRVATVHAFERRPVPKSLRAIIDKATRYEPKDRYPSVAALADDLRRHLRGEAVQALPDSPWQRAQRFVGRHRQGVLLSLLGVIALAALVVAALAWRHEQALLDAQAHETAVRDLVDETARNGDRLQRNLIALQGELDSFALAGVQLLLHGVPNDAVATYWPEDFTDAARRPADLALHAGFERAVSLGWGVWYAAPGVEREKILPSIARLHHLRAFRNELFAVARRSLGGSDYANGVAELRIVLADGTTMRYPGRALEHLDDLRRTPWYQRVTADDGARWGEPYVDADGDTLLLPLGIALRDGDGRVLGAISMDLALDHVVRNVLRDDEHGDAHRLLLLDDGGRVLASDAVIAEHATDAQGQMLLPLFGDAALRAQLQEEEVGAIETVALGAPSVVAFHRIHPLDWVLVQVAKEPLLR